MDCPIYMIIDSSPERNVWAYLNSSGDWNVLDVDNECPADCQFASPELAKQTLEQFCGGDLERNPFVCVVELLGRKADGARIFQLVNG